MKRVKQFVAVILSLAIVTGGIYWSEVPADEVQAATIAEHNVDMLNVKVQVAKDANTNVMRFVSSVDSLNYKKVGFEIAKEGEEPKQYDITTVFKEIESLLGEELKYTFSPKVVDTSSEYFMTGLWNAEPDVNYTVRAYAVTFQNEWIYGSSRCVALEDGRTTTTHLNMSFEASENHGLKAEDSIEVTYGVDNVEATATVIDTDGTTVHVRVQDVKYSDLPSATKFTFGSYGSAIFRNLYTEYTGTGTEDTSWYDIYAEEDSTEDAFVIATDADMYGFMHLLNGGTTEKPRVREVFSGKTVYLVSDIAMNSVTEGVTAKEWAQADLNGTTLQTTPNAWSTNCDSKTTETHFSGTFDGQMHTITGVYVKQNNQYAGLFGITAPNSVVKNFYLEESYFTSIYSDTNSNNEMYIGSVAGQCRGMVENVYSNSIVQSANTKGRKIGGLVGNLHTSNSNYPAMIDNCWFAGKVLVSYANAQAGGIAGYVHTGNTTYKTYILNSLFNGEIGSTSTTVKPYNIGGIVGMNSKSICNIEDCLSVGRFTNQASSSVGSIFGNTVDESEMYLVNAYGVTSNVLSISGAVQSSANNREASKAENLGHGFSEISNIHGKAAYQNTLLDFEDVWYARTGAVPVLKTFRNKINKDTVITDFSDVEQNNWYDDAVTKYGLHSLSAFEAFRDYVNAGTVKKFTDKEVYLNTDIDMNPGWKAAINEETGALEGKEPTNVWTPIGTANAKSFNGKFYGRGHTISGVYTTGSNNHSGLFGYLDADSVISELQIVNSWFEIDALTAVGYVGSVVGFWNGGTISNVYSNAYVVGQNALSSNSGNIYYDAGGLVGRAGNDGVNKTMETCWFDGVVADKKNGDAGDRSRIGGLIGMNNVNGVSVLTINNSFHTGELTTKEDLVYIGGFVGQTGAKAAGTNTVSINCCLNLGVLQSSYVQTKIGAVIGYLNAQTGTGTVDVRDSIGLNTVDAYGSGGEYNKGNDTGYVTYTNLEEVIQSFETPTDAMQAFTTIRVEGTTTGMNNAVQGENLSGTSCLILNDFKDWWLEYYNLEEATLNLLMIGNSFSYYYVEELYGLAEAAGIKMAVYNLYSSGSPVWEHRDWLEEDAENYEFYVTDSEGRRKVSPRHVGLKEALTVAEWDAISLQSGRQQAVTDYAELEELNLVDAKYLYDYLRQEAPDARLMWHHAWEYEVGYDKDTHSESAASTGSTDGQDVPSRENQMLRHEVNHELALAICEENDVEMVPTGDAWELLRASYTWTAIDDDGTEYITATDSGVDANGDAYKYLCARPSIYKTYNKERFGYGLTDAELAANATAKNELIDIAAQYGDMYHDGDVGGGQYLNACVWFEVLTGKSCVGNTYVPTYTYNGTTYEMLYDASVLQQYAHQAVEGLKDMQTLYKQVEPIVEGAARVTLESDGIHFYRFTEEQYASVDERCTIAVQDATAGVRLHFKTDSENLTLKVRTSEGVASDHDRTKQFSHDIYVNGELKYELKDEGIEWSELYGDYVGTYELGEGTKEVCIYFPWSVCSVLTGFSLDEGSSLEPVTKDKTVVFYGDSITNGRDVSNPSMHYTARLAEALNATWINKGVSGDVFRPAFAEMKDDVEPDYIVVAYGTNHFKSGIVDDVTTKIQSFYDNLVKTYPDAIIFAVTPIWRSNADAAQTEFQNLWEISAIIENAAEQYDNVIAIDGTDFVPHDTAYYSDDLHPNDAGFEQYSSSLIEAINAILANNP